MKAPKQHALAACALAAALAVAGGCASDKPAFRERARANWNAARARVLLNLADEQFAHGNADDARKTADEALAMSQSVAGVYVLKAKLDVEAGDLRAATASLEAAALLDPADAEIDYLAGMVAERWQRPDDALFRYRAAWQKDETQAAYLLALGETLVGVGRLDEAAALLEGRLRYFESDAQPPELLAQVYQQQGRFADAAEMFRRAAVLADNDAALRRRQATALTLGGDYRAGLALLEALAAGPEADDAALHLGLAECQLQAGEAAAARSSFQRAARLDDKSLPAWLGTAKAALTLDDFDRAELALVRAAALRPAGRDAADVALLRGYLRLKQGRLDDAAFEFAAAAEFDPSDETAAALLAYCRRGPDGPDAAALMRAVAGADVGPAVP